MQVNQLITLYAILTADICKNDKVVYNSSVPPEAAERVGHAMDVQVGDVIQTKKQHPCGSNRFDVLRVGMDFKIRCQGCGREVMLPRVKIEKNIKKVLRDGQETSRP